MLALLREENIPSGGLQALGKLRCRVWVKKIEAECCWVQKQRWEEIMQIPSKGNCGVLGSESSSSSRSSFQV